MPTAPDDEPPVQDESGAPDDAPGPAGLDTFLSAVRGMVHGEVAPASEPGVASDAEPGADSSPVPGEWVADEEPAGWLPGTWVVDAPEAPRRRADRGVEKSLARQEKKLREAERRNARASRKGRRKAPGNKPEAQAAPDLEPTVRRIPAQAEAATVDLPADVEPLAQTTDTDARRDRRQRRREAARAQAVASESEDELVPSGPLPSASPARGSRRSSRRARRREAGPGGAGGDPGESGETPAVSGAMSDTARMSKLAADTASPADQGPAMPPGPDLPTQSRSARRSERKAARRAGRAEARAAAVQQQLAAEAARVAQVEQKRLAKAEKREGRLGEQASRKAGPATERERRAEEVAARKDAEAGVRARHDAERAVRDAARAAESAAGERHRLEGKLARLEAKAAARADKDARRLARRVGRADAKAMAEAEALERRQDRRARRIEKRRTRADARSAAEIQELESRRQRRSRRLEKKSSRAEAKARAEAERLEQRRDEIDRRLAPAAPGPDPAVDDESLAHYLGRVESSILPWRSRRSRSRVPLRVRRAVRIGAVCVLIGGAAVLPWAAPRVPGLIADAVPGGDAHVATVKDPPVGPRTNAIAGPVGIATQTNPLDGVRLAAAGWPRRVQVPRLHVDSTVVPISGQSGSLLPPSDPLVLGWWREGKPVGAEFGTAVITGHTVHTGGGALDNLDKLAVGDTLRVQTDDGWITYVVQRARIYSTTELARDASDIFRLSGPGRLVMITCDDWNGTFYESNAVVFASPTADDPS